MIAVANTTVYAVANAAAETVTNVAASMQQGCKGCEASAELAEVSSVYTALHLPTVV